MSELKKKEKRVEESYISYEHWGMVKEDVKTTTSHMIQTEVDKNKDNGVGSFSISFEGFLVVCRLCLKCIPLKRHSNGTGDNWNINFCSSC